MDVMEKELDLYKKFYHELWEKYQLKKADILDWTYAGYFHGDLGTLKHLTNKEDIAKNDLGKRFWVDVMGPIPMPYDLAEDICVCEVKILWNHILVKDPTADVTEMLILGSECIDKFIGISRKRKCKMCNIEIRNIKIGLCKDCKKRQEMMCITKDCQNRKQYNKQKCNRCIYPNEYCPCGINKKKKYDGKFMPECYACWSMNKSKTPRSNTTTPNDLSFLN